MEHVPAIALLRDQEPIAFAAQELARYLARVSSATPEVRGVPEGVGAIDTRTGLWLGTFADFSPGFRPWPAVGSPALDDAIYVETSGPAGVIAGSNPRSVLLAVYRYLAELGCRWVRPGGDGEHVPRVDLAGTAVRVAEAASYRHRGICIEGAVSYEHVRDIVDWAPKLGFNSYFTQFREAYTFFERWYAHRENPFKQPEPLSVEQARTLKARLGTEIKRRGLVFHDVGHGWTCEPFGIPGLGWEYEAPPVPPHVTQYLAEIDGERALFRGVPLNTNLCYSTPEVRAIVVDDVAGYARDHPEVDVVHFWLADGSNNQCECAGCREARPADWYVRLLNELNEQLTAQRLDVRIVFLIYVDLLWPPERERIQNPDRFILMFAPITRTYSRAFTAGGRGAVTAPVGEVVGSVGEVVGSVGGATPPLPPDLPPYERNKLRFPRSVEGNVAFLRAWQRLFPGDSFDFDYHFMWDHYKDPGYVAIAEVLHQDIRNLREIGLDGLVSCQEQRAFFPTGLGMAVMGRTLWNAEQDFGDLAQDYFAAAFGTDGAACREYCTELSWRFDPPYLRGEKTRDDPEAAASYAAIPDVIARFRPVIQRNLGLADPCHARSWHYLDAHADVCLQLAQALRFRTQGQDEEARNTWAALKRMVQEREDDLHPVLDVYEFSRVLGGLFR